MRKFAWMLAIMIGVSALLAGCGAKSADDIVKELDGKLEEMKSYQAAGAMVLYTGEDPQKYSLEVWYQTPNYYRIQLSNENREMTQIVLRNDDGVFVLNPHLKKSFRFQSDWPNRQGQVYLYQTLVQSIVSDQSRQFAEDGASKSYVFDVAANYANNAALVRQKIWLDKTSYAPRQVKVNDAQNQTIVEVTFSDFVFNKSFEKNDFDMQRNLMTWDIQTFPTMAEITEMADGENTGADDADAGTGADELAAVEGGDFGIIEPDYRPAGVERRDMQDVTLGGEAAVLLRYMGDYNYSIMESRPVEQSVNSVNGEVLDLGYMFGVLVGNQMKTLHWMYDGVEFRLSSSDLPKEEMVKIAQSVQGAVGK